MTARAILSGLLLSLLFGCGGGGSNNSVNGTVRGKSMQAVDAIAGTGAGAAIALSSTGGICGKVSAGQQPKSTQFLIFILQDVAGQQASAPTLPGTYPIAQSGAKTSRGCVHTNRCQLPERGRFTGHRNQRYRHPHFGQQWQLLREL